MNEDKIEVGEYVRLKDGRIRIFKNMLDKENVELTRPYNIARTTDIVKHSSNILDLIEKGDYVNGYEVLDKYLFNGEKPVLETSGEETNCKCLCNGDIRTVVTKEQFESMEYKV